MGQMQAELLARAKAVDFVIGQAAAPLSIDMLVAVVPAVAYVEWVTAMTRHVAQHDHTCDRPHQESARRVGVVNELAIAHNNRVR